MQSDPGTLIAKSIYLFLPYLSLLVGNINSCRSGGAVARTMWRGRVDDMNDEVLEGGRERWIQERSGGLDFDHAIDFCLAIDFSRLAVNLVISGVTPVG